jgi:hypothetical protein
MQVAVWVEYVIDILEQVTVQVYTKETRANKGNKGKVNACKDFFA